MATEDQDVIPKENSFLQLPVSVGEIVSAMESYQDLLKKLLVSDDYATIQNKKCIKKAGWLKLARAFNLSIKIIDERKLPEPDTPTSYAYHITVSCTASNGREVQELGSCDTNEKPSAAEHVIRSMAITRAKSRAIASMIGASESSAEDMDAVSDEPATPKQIEYLTSLGHAGPTPKTKQEASQIIESLKEGATPSSSSSSTKQDTFDKKCDCDEPCYGKSSNKCLNCGGIESQ